MKNIRKNEAINVGVPDNVRQRFAGQYSRFKVCLSSPSSSESSVSEGGESSLSVDSTGDNAEFEGEPSLGREIIPERDKNNTHELRCNHHMHKDKRMWGDEFQLQTHFTVKLTKVCQDQS